MLYDFQFFCFYVLLLTQKILICQVSYEFSTFEILLIILNNPNTDMLNENGPFAHLWSKMLIFKRAFHKLRVLPHLLQPQNFRPLIRALDWGTIKRFSSRDIRMVKGQSFRVLTLLNNKSVFQNFLLLSLAVFMPFEENL